MADTDTASAPETPVEFTINGKKYTLNPRVPLGTSLNEFLREHANLRGTKVMCHEAGCGVCVVAVTSRNPTTGADRTYAVNSCLFPVHSCHRTAVTTVEGLGSTTSGMHRIQRALAEHHGSQCGYCSPGMVMNMFSLRADQPVTMSEVENSFGGNICRCTGYRPILDAFKSLAMDATPELLSRCHDIEDLGKAPCAVACPWRAGEQEELEVREPGASWYRVTTVDHIYRIFDHMPNGPYMLVSGNTAQGVYRRTQEPMTYIDVTRVAELRDYALVPQLTVGANMTLTDAMAMFRDVSKEPQYAYASQLADHIDLIANVPVRNTGTLAGNLSIKHEHPEFSSDIFLILETVGAKLQIGSSRSSLSAPRSVTLPAFLEMDMNRKLIHSVTLPPMGPAYILRTYKIMPRAQNAHAYVNAGFLFKLNRRNNGEVVEKPRIVFGGINPEFIHASRTEEYLRGKQLFDTRVLQGALRVLDGELKADYQLPDATPAYRNGLAKALFYKFVLNIAPNPKKTYASGGEMLHRPLSTARHKFQTDRKEWPLNQPVIKKEAYAQCTGEAQYVNDFPTIPGELFASFVVAPTGPGTLGAVDPTDAMALPGVVCFLTAGDIPGRNNFTQFTPQLYNMSHVEEILCSGHVLFAGQPVGVMVAETQELARRAAALVTVPVATSGPPVLTVEDAVRSGDKSRLVTEVSRKPKSAAAENEAAARVLQGEFRVGSQYHFTMETQCCLCLPLEDGMDVYSSSMWMDLIQRSISESLAVPENSINVIVRRLGGGFGAKISRSAQVAAACALAANTLNRPVRFVMSLEENVAVCGKRYDGTVKYEVGCDPKGKIQYLKTEIFQNSGCNLNESTLTDFTMDGFQSGYDSSTWTYSGTAVLTDVHSNTYMRGPGTFEGDIYIEHIMEHIAAELGLDSLQVRMQNLDPADTDMPPMIADMRASSELDKRRKAVDQFNKDNRWKKRGIAAVVMKFPIVYFPGYYALVSIYSGDGTVSVCHGGIECGQGINTKVAQVVAKFLGVPLDTVTVKPSNNLTAPNSQVTGASITSESCAYAAMVCCQELTKRLEPLKKRLGHVTWKELVAKAYEEKVDLLASYMFKSTETQAYGVHGVTVAEVELDILTGQHLVERVDILEDAGKSLSPELDVGQVEGAFIMGMGYFLSEQVVHDPATGRVLTDRTWNYKPPGAKDIPVDFRVELRPNAANPVGVLRSKTTGEPAICMSSSIFFAIKNALLSARKDAGRTEKWFIMDAPATTEQIFLNSLTSYEQFSL